jgi:hypothetical protein
LVCEVTLEVSVEVGAGVELAEPVCDAFVAVWDSRSCGVFAEEAAGEVADVTEGAAAVGAVPPEHPDITIAPAIAPTTTLATTRNLEVIMLTLLLSSPASSGFERRKRAPRPFTPATARHPPG